MSILGGITKFLTGGRDQQGEQALNNAMAAISGVHAPTQQELSLPELEDYVNAGLMTPAEAQAYLQEYNAFENQNIDQTGTRAQIEALNALSGIADAGPMGTPQEQAQVAQVIQQMNNAVQGNRGAIEQEMAAKGTPAAMVQAALSNLYNGQDAQQAYHNSLDAQANAYQAALNAIAQKGTVGQNLQSQQNTQANTVAAAQNAMQQFNAANQQNAAEANAARAQQANAYNTENTQNVSNANTQTRNSRTAYNTEQAQTAFDDAMRKAQAQADVATKQAQNYANMGKQNAGTAAGIISAISPAANSALNYISPSGAGAGGAGAGAGAVQTGIPMGMMAEGGMVHDHAGCYHDGGICMDDGGMVPGEASTPGNSLENDTVHIMASPGEAVIPRTAVQNNMPEVMGLIAEGRHGAPMQPDVDPSDVAILLQALGEIRMGVPA